MNALTISTIVFGLLVIIGCSQVNRYLGLEDDHAIEQMIEKYILEKADMEVDFTPDSD
jgi:hypothetical protein